MYYDENQRPEKRIEPVTEMSRIWNIFQAVISVKQSIVYIVSHCHKHLERNISWCRTSVRPSSLHNTIIDLSFVSILGTPTHQELGLLFLPMSTGWIWHVSVVRTQAYARKSNLEFWKKIQFDYLI
jgi:hypothetical protein